MKNRLKAAGLTMLIALSAVALTACQIGEKDYSLGEILLIIVGIIVGMIIVNTILEFLAIKFAFIYWPACVIAALVIFFKAYFGGLNKNTGNVELTLWYYVAQAILLYFLLPNFDDSVKHYTQITYEYDYTWGKYVETNRKPVKEEIPGFMIKLFAIGLFMLAIWIIAEVASSPKVGLIIILILEIIWGGRFSYYGIKRFVQYRR